jgi:hypothetical protein
LLGLLLPKKDYEVDDIIFWAAMVDGGMWYVVWCMVGGGGSTFVNIVAGKRRKLAPSISVEMVRLARPFSSRLSFAA